MTRKLVFLDIETTGLEASTNQITELSYAVEDGPINTLYFGVAKVNSYIDELTSYYARGVHLKPRFTMEQLDKFRAETAGQTMVSANPKFDASFLDKYSMYEFHHRTLDVESYAMKALGLDFVPGMKELYDIMTGQGFTVPEPDHSSFGDVQSMRKMFNILRYRF